MPNLKRQNNELGWRDINKSKGVVDFKEYIL